MTLRKLVSLITLTVFLGFASLQAWAEEPHSCATHCSKHSDESANVCATHCATGSPADHDCAKHCESQPVDGKNEACVKHCEANKTSKK